MREKHGSEWTEATMSQEGRDKKHFLLLLLLAPMLHLISKTALTLSISQRSETVRKQLSSKTRVTAGMKVFWQYGRLHLPGLVNLKDVCAAVFVVAYPPDRSVKITLGGSIPKHDP